MWKKGTLLALAGFAAGVLIGIFFTLKGNSGGLEASDIPHLLIGGLYGAAACAGSLVYDIEKWSIARATATHFLSTLGLYLLICFSLGWFTLSDSAFWITIGAMMIGYVLMWLFMYLGYRREIRKMNEELARWKSRAGQE